MDVAQISGEGCEMQADTGTAVVEHLNSEMLYHKLASLLHQPPRELLPLLNLGHVCIQGRIGLVSSGAHIVVIGHGLQRDRPIALWKPYGFFPSLHLSCN